MPGTFNPLCAIHLTPSDKEYTNTADVQDEFEVLVPGSFPRTAVSVEYRAGRSLLDPSAQALIDRAWHSYLRTSSEAGIAVYNGALFRLDSFERTGDRLRLELSDTDFRECVGTASKEFRSAFPDLPQANPLAASVALVTGDGKIIIEKRTRTDSRRRAYHVIAGYMEREKDGRQPHPFDTLKREVHEELGVGLNDADLRATGLVRALYGSEICSRCRLALSFDDGPEDTGRFRFGLRDRDAPAPGRCSGCRCLLSYGPPRGPRAARESMPSPLRPRRHTERSGTKRRCGYEGGGIPRARSEKPPGYVSPHDCNPGIKLLVQM